MIKHRSRENLEVDDACNSSGEEEIVFDTSSSVSRRVGHKSNIVNIGDKRLPLLWMKKHFRQCHYRFSNHSICIIGLIFLLYLFLWKGDIMLDTRKSVREVDSSETMVCKKMNIHSSSRPLHEEIYDDMNKFLEAIDLQPQRERCMEASDSCACENPIRPSQPNSKSWNASWQVAFQRNLKLSHDPEGASSKTLDVVLLGDSITESWHGTGLTRPRRKYNDNAQVYRQLFDSESSPVKGLALGISGDRCRQLLYRLRHGEIQGLLHVPKVFWVLIGTNDWIQESCHPDQIVAGIIGVVQEITKSTSSAAPAASGATGSTVVIQSLLPWGDAKSGLVKNWDVYSEINQRLACYAHRTPNVEFFNVTALFLSTSTASTTDGKQAIMINKTMLPDGLHPAGSIAAETWGKEIVRKVKEIIQQKE